MQKKTTHYCLLKIFVMICRSIFAVYYALITHAKIKVCVNNFLLDICWSTRAFRRGNLETPESRGYKCSSQNFIKDTIVSLYRIPRVQEHLVYLIHWCTRYICKFFRKRYRQMRVAFFKIERSVILLRDSTTNNARLRIKVVHIYQCY